MLNYFKIVQSRLVKAFLICTAIFSIALGVMLVLLAVSKNDFEEFLSMEALAYSVVVAAVISIFIVLLAFFTEFNEFRMQQNLLSKIPLASIGFVKIQLLKNSLWKLHKEAYAAYIGNFYVIVDFYAKGKVSFAILSSRDLNLQIQLPNKYREIEVFPESSGITMVIPVDSFWTPSVSAINELLVSLTFTMDQQGYQPARDLKLYEKKLKKDLLAKALSGSVG
jgi:uncharacterized membrane protein